MPPRIDIRQAVSRADLEAVRLLLREYAAYLNASLGSEHICLDSYEKELAELPGLYAPPRGALLLLSIDNEPAGCGALKPFTPHRPAVPGEIACEMKRLWVRPQFRAQGLGIKLTETLLQHAQARNYTAMYLDTIPSVMRAAHRIYTSLGFQPVEKYGVNPVLAPDSPLEVKFYRRSLPASEPPPASLKT